MNYLNKAIKAHQDNNLTLAKELYLAQIQLNSKDPNAKQLLGLLYFNEQDYQNARVYMEASLKLNKKQPHVITNLGSVYLKQSNSQMAVDCFKSAIEIDKNYVEAYINLARTFRQLKDYDNSEKVIVEATKLFSNNLIIVKEYGALLKATDRYIDLVKFYEPLLNTFTDKKFTFDYALALRIIGKSEEALLYFHALEKDGMSNYQLFHNIGNSYSDIGQLSQAINYYARAINQNMLYVDSHKNLNELIWETGQFDIFLSSYVTAIKHYPDDPALNFGYISSLIRASKHEFAQTCMNELPASLSNYEDYYLLQAKVLNHDGLAGDAINTLKQGLKVITPSNDYLLELSKSFIASSRFLEAEKLLITLLQHEPNNQMAIAHLGVCYQITDKEKESQINNYEELVKVFDLTVTPELNSVPGFFEDLNSYLDSLHTSNTQPLEQTLSNGSQTRGNIFNNINPLLTIAEKQIYACVEQYNSELSEAAPQHTISPSNNYRMAGSWSVRLNQEGFHSMHVHPMGWLSAVLYVELPCDITTSDKSGWLKFGEPNLVMQQPINATKFIKPEVGKLVIFPSYMWHGTVPFMSNEHRTTIAFDIKRLD